MILWQLSIDWIWSILALKQYSSILHTISEISSQLFLHQKQLVFFQGHRMRFSQLDLESIRRHHLLDSKYRFLKIFQRLIWWFLYFNFLKILNRYLKFLEELLGCYQKVAVFRLAVEKYLHFHEGQITLAGDRSVTDECS